VQVGPLCPVGKCSVHDHLSDVTLSSNGCGLDIGVKDGKVVGVRGRAADRVNHGRLGPKGLHAWKSLHHGDRLLYPQIRRNGKLERATWEEAMTLIVQRTRDVQRRLTNHGIGQSVLAAQLSAKSFQVSTPLVKSS